jgi:hypothetical protein
MTNDKRGYITGAATTFILFVLFPIFLPRYIPSEITQIITRSGFNLSSFFHQVMLMGLMTAGLSIANAYVEPNSPYALAIMITKNISSFIFMVIFLGAGQIMNLGITEIPLKIQNTINLIRIDLQVFIWITLGIVLLKIIQSVLEWREVRIELSPKIRIPNDDSSLTTPIEIHNYQNNSEQDYESLIVHRPESEQPIEETSIADTVS